MNWRQGQTAILTQVLLATIAALLPHLGGSLRAQSPLSAGGSHFGILSPTVSNRLGTWLYYSAVLLLIYTGASLDWQLSRGSIYNKNTPVWCQFQTLVYKYIEPGSCYMKMTFWFRLMMANLCLERFFFLTKTFSFIHITHSSVNCTWFALLSHQKLMTDLCSSWEN